MATIKKNTKKAAYVVDLTKYESCADVKFEFVRAKAKAGAKITDDDISFLLSLGADIAFEIMEEKFKLIKPMYTANIDGEKVRKIIKIIQKKDPWYKRFWKWLTKPFRKNK